MIQVELRAFTRRFRAVDQMRTYDAVLLSQIVDAFEESQPQYTLHDLTVNLSWNLI